MPNLGSAQIRVTALPRLDITNLPIEVDGDDGSVYSPVSYNSDDDQVFFKPSVPFDCYTELDDIREKDSRDIRGYPTPRETRPSFPHLLYDFETLGLSPEDIALIEKETGLVCFCGQAVRTHGICTDNCTVCFRCARRSRDEYVRGTRKCMLHPNKHLRLNGSSLGGIEWVHQKLDQITVVDKDWRSQPPFECSWCKGRYSYSEYVRHRMYQCRHAACTLPGCGEVTLRKDAATHRKRECVSGLTGGKCKNGRLVFALNGENFFEDSEMGCTFEGKNARETYEHEMTCGSNLKRKFSKIIHESINKKMKR
ncbi:hypothetical protein M427DRAFT_50287 [Gonapodya prolifera JEL478]|uniref:Uncharacterized protein n=1 Tax=Gonapodya prolifera (strain JEL478) TaxID=1344416 RepID=A0A138ZWH4_GONPJ|nr:hypothetical protein M427DRAFT_50287 [Gonapodya prolifera JEL478]|eukprot:KXS08821.1 hypothetical protein M427DRAFT_50287 [Gonapodya prolifera JEL478]